MTAHKSFKRFVRSRMEKTGESYTAARAVLLSAQQTTADPKPPLATSDEEIRRRSGRGWEEWFDLLDQWGAAERSHRDIARWVAEQLDIVPLKWEAQAITMSYERIRKGRVVGQHPDGFSITASKTVAVPVEQLYDAFVDEATRRTWMADGKLRQRTATAPRSARFDWGDGQTRIAVTFDGKGESKSTASLTHARLADAAEAQRMKTFWRERMAVLKSVLEGREHDG